MTESDHQPVLKDIHRAQPIPTVWRKTLSGIVRAFGSGDFMLSHGVADVDPVDDQTANQIRAYLADYGATLTELPDETWRTSAVQWYGEHWEFLVDLWTSEDGRSDLVLSGRVIETGDRYRFKVHLVYVP